MPTLTAPVPQGQETPEAPTGGFWSGLLDDTTAEPAPSGVAPEPTAPVTEEESDPASVGTLDAAPGHEPETAEEEPSGSEAGTLILGKFKSPDDLAHAYQEAQKALTQRSQEAAALRRQAETAGWQVATDGTLTPPTPAASAPAGEDALQAAYDRSLREDSELAALYQGFQEAEKALTEAVEDAAQEFGPDSFEARNAQRLFSQGVKQAERSVQARAEALRRQTTESLVTQASEKERALIARHRAEMSADPATEALADPAGQILEQTVEQLRASGWVAPGVLAANPWILDLARNAALYCASLTAATDAEPEAPARRPLATERGRVQPRNGGDARLTREAAALGMKPAAYKRLSEAPLSELLGY